MDTYEYLGLNIDRHLTMAGYVDKIIKKVSHKLYTLNIMRQYISERTSLLIDKVMIRPHYDYVDFVIDLASQDKTSRPSERLHKRALRTIEYTLDSVMKGPIADLFIRYNQRRVAHLLLFIYYLCIKQVNKKNRKS